MRTPLAARPSRGVAFALDIAKASTITRSNASVSGRRQKVTIIIQSLSTGEGRIHDRVTMSVSLRLFASQHHRQCISSRTFTRTRDARTEPLLGSTTPPRQRDDARPARTQRTHGPTASALGMEATKRTRPARVGDGLVWRTIHARSRAYGRSSSGTDARLRGIDACPIGGSDLAGHRQRSARRQPGRGAGAGVVPGVHRRGADVVPALVRAAAVRRYAAALSRGSRARPGARRPSAGRDRPLNGDSSAPIAGRRRRPSRPRSRHDADAPRL